MGLLDFALDMGKKLFSGDDDPAEKIKASINADNPGISNLDVSFENGKVSLKGDAESQDALEKAVLMAGNVQGVSDVSIEDLTAPAASQEFQYYVVEKGDTLSAIAKQFLGNANDYPRIFEANKEVIKDPDLIYPGQKIRIPAA